MLPNDRSQFTKQTKAPQFEALQQLTQLVTQASRTKSVIPSQTKRIVEVQRQTDKQEKVIHTTREINSQQSVRNYFEPSTSKNNKENISVKSILNQEYRSMTPLAHKNPVSINTRGRGSVSPLRCVQQNFTSKSTNKSAIKQQEDPQIMNMVDHLKQNILRDLQEVTKRYQSTNPKPIEVLQKQNEKIKHLLEYKEPQIKVPYFDCANQKDENSKIQKYFQEDEQTNKHQFLEQQSLILQQQLEIIKQQQEALRQQQFTVLNSKTNLPNFYSQMRKQQSDSIEDAYGKSQFTISNISSIIPVEVSQNQNKKINVSFESSLEQNQIQLQLDMMKCMNDCRTTFGPSQLESLIKSPTQQEPELFCDNHVLKENVKYVQIENNQSKVSSAKRYENENQEIEKQEQFYEQQPPPSAFSNKSNRYDQLLQNFQSIRKLSREPSFIIETKKSVQMNDLNHISDFAILGSQRESIALCQTKLITFQEINNSQEQSIQSPKSFLSKQTSQKQNIELQSNYYTQNQSEQQSLLQFMQNSSQNQQQQSELFQKQSVSIQQSTEQTNRILESIKSSESFKQRTASFTEFLRNQDENLIKINTLQKISLRPAISFLQYKQQNKY